MADTDRHEHSDVSLRAILWFVVALVLTVVVMSAAVWRLFEVFDRRAQQADPTPSPLARGELAIPPEPRLQGLPWRREWTTPRQELTAYRAAELQRLEHYAWVDRNKGLVRIPIVRAMEIVAEQGGR